MVVANGENASEPNGIDKQSALLLFDCGVDVITTGNHIWRKSNVFEYLDDESNILRPLNFPPSNPGHGETVITVNGYRVLVMNVLGEAYMDSSASPFEAVEKCLDASEGKYDIALLDVHAEATGEKKALGYYFSDRISAIFGTHTHVQTNDAQILSGRCAYVTDLGMCGAVDSILGVKKEAVIYRLRTKMLSKFDFATGEIRCQGAIFEINMNEKIATSCELINF